MTDPRNKPTWREERFDNPSAGAEFIITPTTAAHWLIKSLAFVFTASAFAVNRRVRLLADNGSDVFFATTSEQFVTATNLSRYSAFGGASFSSIDTTVQTMSLPDEGLFLPQGFRLRSNTLNIDAADQYSEIRAFIVEFPTGPQTHYWPLTGVIEEESS